jgi:predicted nucleotidyltransferase
MDDDRNAELSMPRPVTSAILQQVKPRLAGAFGPRLRGVVLFGSEARGDAAPDSDIDLFVLLEGPNASGNDTETIVRTLYPLQMELLDRPIHALPVDVEDFEGGVLSVYRNAKREGIWL